MTDDDGFFEWALAHFRENPVTFSDTPEETEPVEDADTRRKRLDRLTDHGRMNEGCSAGVDV